MSKVCKLLRVQQQQHQNVWRYHGVTRVGGLVQRLLHSSRGVQQQEGSGAGEGVEKNVLAVDGNLVCKSDFVVDSLRLVGSGRFGGDVRAKDFLFIDGVARVKGNVVCEGTTTAKRDIHVLGNVLARKDLLVGKGIQKFGRDVNVGGSLDIQKGAYMTVNGALKVAGPLDLFQAHLTVKGTCTAMGDVSFAGMHRYTSHMGFLISEGSVTVRRGMVGRFIEKHTKTMGQRLERLFSEKRLKLVAGGILSKKAVHLEGVKAAEVIGHSVVVGSGCDIGKVRCVEECVYEEHGEGDDHISNIVCEKITEEELQQVYAQNTST
eukprot:Nk52_evm62s78 gene=Nk52_evmTU62s78